MQSSFGSIVKVVATQVQISNGLTRKESFVVGNVLPRFTLLFCGFIRVPDVTTCSGRTTIKTAETCFLRASASEQKLSDWQSTWRLFRVALRVVQESGTTFPSLVFAVQLVPFSTDHRLQTTVCIAITMSFSENRFFHDLFVADRSLGTPHVLVRDPQTLAMVRDR